MFMPNQSTYLLDANAIRELSANNIKDLIKKFNVITLKDVSFEVSGLTKSHMINSIELQASAYEKITEILSDFEEVRILLDYHENKGSADVCILGFVLTANDGRLIPDNYMVVTGDVNLQTACGALGIPWMSRIAIQRLLSP